MPPEHPPGPGKAQATEENSHARALERRLALPVLVCALVSVPAVFLDMWGEGLWAEIGNRTNWLAGLVLWAEWILLIALAEDKLGWLRTHKWSTFVAAVTLPAVVFALGPAQVLRLVRAAGTLRLLRVTRIIEAGGVLRRRMGLTGTRGTVVAVATTVLSAVFVTAVLLNPDSPSRRFLAGLPKSFELWQVALALGLVGAATALILYLRRRGAGRTGRDQSSP
ncbi:hypothetical protein [Nocardiopsis ganjiahuensis]|uniref:hypothetical protein n=1 Tax=Nocardiopsis ganjiahuensis TaxID=239984 RepID=UPI000345966E|nr:hypothetical protein [Nocardiopsis ganjiahuensis]